METIFKNMIKEYTTCLAEIYNFDANEAFDKVYKDKRWKSTSKGISSKGKGKANSGSKKLNAYNIYTKEKSQELKTTRSDLLQKERMRLIGSMWKESSPEQQQEYRDKAKTENEKVEQDVNSNTNTINNLSIKQLKVKCKEKGLKNYSKLNKDDTIKLLRTGDDNKTDSKEINKIPKGRREASPNNTKQPIRRKTENIKENVKENVKETKIKCNKSSKCKKFPDCKTSDDACKLHICDEPDFETGDHCDDVKDHIYDEETEEDNKGDDSGDDSGDESGDDSGDDSGDESEEELEEELEEEEMSDYEEEE